MKQLKEDELLEAWLKGWDSFKVFSHSMAKMFHYLNMYFLAPANCRKISEECL